MEKKFETFTKNLIKWNKTHKLTNYSEKEIKEQIEDSLYPLKYLEEEIKNAIDIGTGAGFPGLILAIAMPQTKWYLVEPLKKRYSFLNYMKILLGLNNVEVVPKRIEEADIPKAKLITSRAVMKTKDLINLSKPYLTKNGTILLYKGSNVMDELKGIKAKVISNRNRNYVFIKEKDV
ncbi:16S rRNA (guanine(527)-N(7))-methyltransferase RsmG [Caminibacter sp.]